MGYLILEYHLTAQGTCPQCGTRIPGVWPSSPELVPTGTGLQWLERRPRPVRR